MFHKEKVGPKTIGCSLSAVGLGTTYSDISALKTPIVLPVSPSTVALIKVYIIYYLFPAIILRTQDLAQILNY